MTIASTLQELQKALDDGLIEKATALVGASVNELSSGPRALLPVLDALDRQKKNELLSALAATLQNFNILPLESSIFDLRAKFRAGSYGDALQAVEKILAVSNENVEALRTGGRIGNLTGDEAVALGYWERLARVGAKDPEAALQVARIYSRRRQYAPALTWARIAVERRPEAMEPVQIAVGAALEVGWPQECDALLATLFSTDRARALKSLIRLARELDVESAARLISFLQQRLPEEHAIAEVASKTFSEWLVEALDQERAAREPEAVIFYRAARAVQPGNAEPQDALDRLSVRSLLAMREAFHGRDFSATVEHGEAAIRINPECVEAWQTIGRAQLARGDVAQACEAFRRCSELDGKNAQTWLTYGLVLNQAGDRRGALRAFQTARDLGDTDARREADAALAALHPQLVRDATQAAIGGNFELAWQFADAALSIRREDAGLDQLRRNLLRQQHGQIRDAWNTGADNTEALCRSYLAKAPADPYVTTVLGRTLMRARAYAEALPVWEIACGLSPQDAHPFLQVARCCRSLRLKAKGLAAAAMALKLAPALQEAADLAAQFKTLM